MASKGVERSELTETEVPHVGLAAGKLTTYFLSAHEYLCSQHYGQHSINTDEWMNKNYVLSAMLEAPNQNTKQYLKAGSANLNGHSARQATDI